MSDLASGVRCDGLGHAIQLPTTAPLCLEDAGNVRFDESTSPPTVLHLAGPHQQFSGDVSGLCNYFMS